MLVRRPTALQPPGSGPEHERSPAGSFSGPSEQRNEESIRARAARGGRADDRRTGEYHERQRDRQLVTARPRLLRVPVDLGPGRCVLVLVFVRFRHGLGPGGTSSAATAPAQSPYQSAYDDLVQQDTAELLQVSFGSQADAQSNLASVLAQAAALQRQQLAAQQQAQSAAPPPIAAPSVPTLTSLLQQSDGDASGDLAQGTLGASVDTTA